MQFQTRKCLLPVLALVLLAGCPEGEDNQDAAAAQVNNYRAYWRGLHHPVVGSYPTHTSYEGTLELPASRRDVWVIETSVDDNVIRPSMLVSPSGSPVTISIEYCTDGSLERFNKKLRWTDCPTNKRITVVHENTVTPGQEWTGPLFTVGNANRLIKVRINRGPGNKETPYTFYFLNQTPSN